MDRKTNLLLIALYRAAKAIPDDELRDSDRQLQPEDVPLGELDETERRLYTLILRKLEAMEALTAEVRQARLSGRMTDGFNGDMIRAFATLTNEQMLLNEFLGFRLHRRLGIPKKLGIAVRQGWQVIEVPMTAEASMVVSIVVEPSDEDGPPDDDPTEMN